MTATHPEFRDFPLSDLPTLPAGFSDTSWHNDTCPNYSRTLANGDTLRIWINYANPALREYAFEGPRFCAYRETSAGDAALIALSDDWSAIAAVISSFT